MDTGLQVLSDTVVWSKYGKYIDKLKRRETWNEITDRYEYMQVKKYPQLEESIRTEVKAIREKKVLPSMRALQFAGPAADVNNSRIYNCCYLPIDSIYAFGETMFLLLGGTGVGYSVQKHHVAKLPAITKPTKSRRYLIQDSIIGWADAVKALIKAYLDGKSLPDFDFRDIRKKGARLITAGGKAPGPEPLKECLFQIQKILDRKEDGEYLTPLECHDILCHIANAVLAGGIRRAAMISLFSMDDDEMLSCKFGDWWELNEQRGRANNSAMLLRGAVSEEDFQELWTKIRASGSGEPGIYWTNSLEWGTNPCCEVALKPFQFCNLCEVNASDIESQEDLNKRVRTAAFFGTLQAGFTDFHYLRPIWQKTTEKEALIGVGMTGIASGNVLKYDLTRAAEIVKKTNEETAKIIGINPAARTTLIKPSGTTSCVLGTSSGIHAWYWHWFLRTIQFNKTEDIANYFIVNHPELVEESILRPHDTICVRIPIKAPKEAIIADESPLQTLERVKRFAKEWIKPGHISGINTHNVSATIYIRNEWDEVGEWMWKNRKFYNGLSVLPVDDNSYVQAPFEKITEEEYNERIKYIQSIDLTKVIELDDIVNFGQTAACAGGECNLI